MIRVACRLRRRELVFGAFSVKASFADLPSVCFALRAKVKRRQVSAVSFCKLRYERLVFVFFTVCPCSKNGVFQFIALRCIVFEAKCV